MLMILLSNAECLFTAEEFTITLGCHQIRIRWHSPLNNNIQITATTICNNGIYQVRCTCYLSSMFFFSSDSSEEMWLEKKTSQIQQYRYYVNKRNHGGKIQLVSWKYGFKKKFRLVLYWVHSVFFRYGISFIFLSIFSV